MDKKFKKILSDLNIDYVDKKTSLENKSTWLVRDTNNKKYIFKTVSQKSVLNRSFLRKILIGHNKKAFYNELNFYKYLSEINCKIVNYPKLIETDNESFILIEFIEGEKGWNKSKISNEVLAKNIWSFNSIPSYPFINEQQKKNVLVQRIVRDLFRACFRGILSFKLLLKVLKKMNQTNKLQKEIEPLMIHDDLFGPNNLITFNDDELLFIDFESIRLEKKWILQDIIELSWDREEMKFNKILFNKYLKELKKNYDDFENINFPAQIRMVLIYRMIRILLSTARINSLEFKEQCKCFLNNILLNDKAYTNWSKNIIEITS